MGFSRQEYWSQDPEEIGWRGRWEGGSGWGIHVTPWLIHVNVWQNLLQCCEVISLQQIKINQKKKKYWSQLPFPSPGDLPHPRSPTLQVDAIPSEPPGKTLKKRGDSFNNITTISSPHCRPIIWHSFRAFPVYLKKQFFFTLLIGGQLLYNVCFWCTTGIRSMYILHLLPLEPSSHPIPPGHDWPPSWPPCVTHSSLPLAS